MHIGIFLKDYQNSLTVSQKTKHASYDSATALLGIYLWEMKTYIHTKICTQMFIATVFETLSNWKQSRCPSMGDG